MSSSGTMVTLELHYEICTWLADEAALLDAQRYGDWLELLTDDVRYRMPVRPTLARSSPATLGGMAHFDEDHYSLSKRVQRLQTDHAWTEDPPSRTRRFVTNIRGRETNEPNVLEVDSYLLLFRSRGDVRPAEWVSAARRDLLRRMEQDDLRLAGREIIVDESVLHTQNLAIFL